MDEKGEKLVNYLDKMAKNYKNLKELAPLLSRNQQEGWKFGMDNLIQQLEKDKGLVAEGKPIPSININFRKVLRPFTKNALDIDVDSIPISTSSGKQIRKSWLEKRGIKKEDLKGTYFLVRQ